MQFINKNKRILIISLVVVLGFSVFLVIRNEQRKSGLEPTVTRYYDADSGQTVTDIEGKTPELDGVESNKPRLLGFQSLIESGTSKYQLDTIQNIFINYAQQNKIQEISLKVSSIKRLPHQTSDGIKTITEFEVKFDRKPVYYKTTFIATSLTRTQILLYDPSGKLLFDSGAVEALTDHD